MDYMGFRIYGRCKILPGEHDGEWIMRTRIFATDLSVLTLGRFYQLHADGRVVQERSGWDTCLESTQWTQTIYFSTFLTQNLTLSFMHGTAS